MSVPVFPTLVGLSYPVGRKPTGSQLARKSASGRATKLQQQAFPNYIWELQVDYARSGINSANADWQVLNGFFVNTAMGALPFLWNDPYDGSVTAQAIAAGDASTTNFNFVRTLGTAVEPTQAVSVGQHVFVSDWMGNQLKYITPRTNLALWANDMTQTAWVKSNVSTSTSITGPSGVFGAGTSLTASSANGTCEQSITASNAVYTFSVYLKRVSGSGAIQLTLDGGSTWTTVVPGAGWTQFSITQTVSNPHVGIRIVTNGDLVDAAQAQLETGAVATSPITTTTATVTYTDYAVLTDPDFGLVYGMTFTTAPASGAAITATFSYMWPAWFDDDSMDLSNIYYDFWQLGKITFTSLKTR